MSPVMAILTPAQVWIVVAAMALPVVWLALWLYHTYTVDRKPKNKYIAFPEDYLNFNKIAWPKTEPVFFTAFDQELKRDQRDRNRKKLSQWAKEHIVVERDRIHIRPYGWDSGVEGSRRKLTDDSWAEVMGNGVHDPVRQEVQQHRS